MRILHTESSLGWGGQEIRVMREAQLMAESGHEVHLACNLVSRLSIQATNHARDVSTHITSIKRKRLSDLLGVRKLLGSLRPDIVVCHSSTDHWLSAVARLTDFKKFPIVRARHISTPVSTNWPTRWLYSRGCESIITTGEGIRQSLVAGGLAPESKVWSIPTGLKSAAFENQDKTLARQRLGLPMGSTLIGVVATLRSWKGHDTLIRAFAKLQGDLSLVIVGDGPQRDALTTLVKDLHQSERVIFAGHTDQVKDWFAALDIYAQPSYANEGVPQAILQAMATGLPIVSCPVGGIPEALGSYKAAVLVTPQDLGQLEAALSGMVESLSTLPKREDLRHIPFSEEAMISQCETLYERLIDDTRVQ